MTRSCPLLPGQPVNVLDVPMQSNLIAGRNVSSTSVDSIVFTLDPKDKYLPPGVRRATTTSAIQSRKARLIATPRTFFRATPNNANAAEVAPKTSSSTRAELTLERQRSLLSVFHRMRQTRSAGSNTKSALAWPRKNFSRAGVPTKLDPSDPVPEVPKLPSQVLSIAPTVTAEQMELPIQRQSTVRSAEQVGTVSTSKYNSPADFPYPPDLPKVHSESTLPKVEDHDRTNLLTPKLLNDSHLPTSFTPLEQLREQISFFTEMDWLDPPADGREVQRSITYPSTDPQSTSSVVASSVEEAKTHGHELYPAMYNYAESSSFSYAASDGFSPYIASNTTNSGPMSPCHLSQPETPVMSDFGDEFLPFRRDSETLDQLATASAGTDIDNHFGKPPSRAPPPPPVREPNAAYPTLAGFQGYSLPENEQASVLTIRKLPSIVFKPSTSDSRSNRPNSKQDLVHSWNDGSEHRMSALEELVDDLGYLGELII